MSDCAGLGGGAKVLLHSILFSDPNDTELMFHRIGHRVGSMITEKEFERAMIFCGTGMGIHIAASKCPGVRPEGFSSVPQMCKR